MASGLPWFRMDTDIYANAKVLDVVADHGQKGKAALAVYLFALGYAGAHLTDGVVSKGALRFVHGTPADARILVDAGLFDEVDGGWLICNYGEHQPSRATAEEIKRQRSEAGRKGAEKRWGSG
jgi:hypothetical protein